MTDPFADKLCVVTGAASGIGRAVAVNLARRGAALALSDINEAGLEETRAIIGDVPSNRIRTDKLDVCDPAAIERYATVIKESLGDADYVFNIAGLTRVGRFDETPLSSFEKIMDVNFWGVVRMTKAFLPQLEATKGGVTNISSLFGFIGFPGQAHYCASKFGVRGFSETIAEELSEKGVRVTSVHPGGVATSIARNANIDALPKDAADRSEVEARFDKAAITSAARRRDHS
ncbi:MAG: SDR family oxidoreductase [Parvularculaceae bacterium]